MLDKLADADVKGLSFRALAACAQGKEHCECAENGKNLFHVCFLRFLSVPHSDSLRDKRDEKSRPEKSVRLLIS